MFLSHNRRRLSSWMRLAPQQASDGEIAERGTHEELMGRRGIYAELFRRQLMEEELSQY